MRVITLLPGSETKLVAASDIADRLNVGKAAVSNWQVRDIGFPAPLFTIGRGMIHVWHWDEVRAWAVWTGRLG